MSFLTKTREKNGALPRETAAFYAVTVLFWASLYTYQPTLSPYLVSIGVGYSMIGIIGGSYGLAQMLVRIPLGIISDRLAKRKIFIVLALLVSVVSSVILYSSENPYVILLGRSLAGVSASGWVVFTVLFSSYFDKSKTASRISYLSAFNNAGQVAAMLAGGVAAGYFGFRFPFAAGAGIGALGFALSFLIKENAPENKRGVKIRELVSVIKNKNLLLMSSLSIVSQFIHFGATMTFVSVVASNLGAGGDQLGYLSMTGHLPRIVSSFLCGALLARKFNVKTLFVVSYSLLIANCILIPFCAGLFQLYAVSVLSGFGNGISMTLCISLCTLKIDENKRSAAMGFFQAFYGIGMFAGPVLTGVVADALGMDSAFFFSAAVAAAGLIASVKFVKRETE